MELLVGATQLIYLFPANRPKGALAKFQHTYGARFIQTVPELLTPI